jgi:hypothetical protein
MRWLSRPSRARVRKSRLAVNTLETRVTPAKVPVLTVDAGHSFVSQLAVAQPGAVLQVEPGATIGNLGTTAGLVQNANPGDTTIQVDHPFAVGQVITVNYFGLTMEQALVDGVSGTASPYTVTLHSPLVNSYPVGGLSFVQAAANTLGIGQGLTIQGDPKKPAADLFSGTTLQLFPQNGAARPTTLTNLALQAVGGYSSGNLTLTKDTITSNGNVEPFQAYVARALTVDDVTFTAGAGATLANVVAVSTGAGSINFNDATVTAQSDLSGTAVALNSSTGPISVDDLSLTAQGLVGGDGVIINTGGNVVVGGKANTLTFAKAVTNSGLEVNGGANAGVANVTAKFTGDAGDDGIRLTVSGNVTASKLTATVGGNVLGNNGNGAALDVTASGSAAVTDLVSAVTGTANYGTYVTANGNLTVGGTETVNVTGAVGNTGLYLYSVRGAATVSTPLGVTLGSTANYGLYLNAGYGALSAAKPITVKVTGAVSSDGAYIYGDTTTTLGTVGVTLGSTADYGLYVDGDGPTNLTGPLTADVKGDVSSSGVYVYESQYDLTVSKPITATLGGAASEGIHVETGESDLTIQAPLTATIAGNSSSYGVYVYSNDDTTISAPISSTIGGTADYGAYLYASSGGLTDTGSVSVSVTGSTQNEGLYLYGNGNVVLTGKQTVNLGGTAQYGAYLDAGSGSLTSTGKTAVTVAGQVSQTGLYFYGYTGGKFENAQVTLKNGTQSNGLEVLTYYGDLTVNNLVANVTGAVGGEGLYASTYGNLTAGNLTVNLSSTAKYGLDLESHGGLLSVSKASATIGGDIANSGIYLYSYAGMNVSGVTGTLNGGTTSAGSEALYVDSLYGDGVLSGLNISETGAAADNGVEIHSDNANITVSKSTFNLSGAVATNALEVDAPHGNATVSQNTVTAKAVGNAGFTGTVGGTLTLSKNSITTAGGTAAKLTGSSGDPQIVTGNTFNAGATGTGLAFTGGNNVVASVSGNDFRGNLVGVSIVGNGTDAGNIDLGGGLLGSKGKNNFSGFTGTAGNYAISLTNTNATSTVYALGNTFTAPDATTAIQDETHNGGTGIVKLA